MGSLVVNAPSQHEMITDLLMVENKVLAKESGFSLHAGVSAKSYQKDKIERLCRYITRPAVSLKRLRLSETGKVIYELKKPYKNGTTHVVFEPFDRAG